MGDRNDPLFPDTTPRDIGEYLNRERAAQGFLPQGPAARAPGGQKTESGPFQPEVPQVQTANPFGALYPHVQHPTFKSFERMFRTQSEAAFYDPNLSPERPLAFTVGSFRVPERHYLIVQGYEFSAAKVTGTAATDTVPLEEERMGALWCFDLDVDGLRTPRQCEYEIDPVPIQLQKEGFEATTTSGGRANTNSFFNRAAARSFALAGGPGRAALPFRTEHYGPQGHPFTLLVPPNQIVTGSCIIFRPLVVPLAYVQFDITGFLLPALLLERFMRQVQP